MKAVAVLAVPWVLFITSFFLPSAVKPGHGDFHEMVFVGWDAAVSSFVIGVQLILDAYPRALLYFLWPFTNLLMLASPLTLRPRWSGLRTFFAHLMVLSAALNCLPPFMARDLDLVFKVGYYVWLTSFGLMAGALYILRARSKSTRDV